MTQELIERTVRDWVSTNPRRGRRDLGRLTGPAALRSALSPNEVADALIRLAGQMVIAETRAW